MRKRYEKCHDLRVHPEHVLIPFMPGDSIKYICKGLAHKHAFRFIQHDKEMGAHKFICRICGETIGVNAYRFDNALLAGKTLRPSDRFRWR